MSNVILLKGDPIYKEYNLATSQDVTPGMLLEVTSAGTVQPHSVAGGNTTPLFAREAFGTPLRDIDDEYDQDGERVYAMVCRPGDEVNAFLAIGENVAIGALLQSDGAGALEAYELPEDVEDASGPDVFVRAPVARAVEAKNNSAGSAPARIKVEVL